MAVLHKASTPRIIRMAHPLAFAAFLRHIGAPVDRHFRRQGLPALCEDPDVFVPLQKAWAFFDAAARSEDPMLGWHIGRFAGDRNFHASFIRKLERAPTLYRALQRLVRMVSSEASHLQLGIHERDDDIVLFTHYPDMKGVTGYASSQAYQLAVYIEVIRHYAGKHWMPDEIGIEYPVVPPTVKTFYPGSRILPRQRVGYVTVPRSCLHLHRARDRELRSEGLEQQREELVRQRARVAHDVAVQAVAREHPLRGVDDDAFLEQVRVERGDRDAGCGCDEAPRQRRAADSRRAGIFVVSDFNGSGPGRGPFRETSGGLGSPDPSRESILEFTR